MNLKIYFLSACLICFAFRINAQKLNEMNPEIKDRIESLTSQYNLDAAQVQEMIVIQNRRNRNLQEIKTLKADQPDIYYAKLKSLRVVTEKAMEKIFRPDQVDLLNQERRELEQSFSTQINKMKQEGYSREEIQKALLRLEEEK